MHSPLLLCGLTPAEPTRFGCSLPLGATRCGENESIPPGMTPVRLRCSPIKLDFSIQKQGSGWSFGMSRPQPSLGTVSSNRTSPCRKSWSCSRFRLEAPFVRPPDCRNFRASCRSSSRASMFHWVYSHPS